MLNTGWLKFKVASALIGAVHRRVFCDAGHFHLLAAWPHGDDSGLQTPGVRLAECVVSAFAVGADIDHDVWRCGKNGLLLTDARANVEWAGDRAVTFS